MLTTRLTENFKYTPPGGPEITTPTTINATPAQDNLGRVSVAAEVQADTQYQIPFGLVAKPTFIRITNGLNQDIKLYLGADDNANPFNLAPGGKFEIAMSAPASAAPLVGIWVNTTDTVSEAGYVEYMIFGDPA